MLYLWFQLTEVHFPPNPAERLCSVEQLLYLTPEVTAFFILKIFIYDLSYGAFYMN